MKGKIRVERVPNPQVLVFHVNRVISRAAIQDFWRPLRENSEQYLAKVGKKGAEIVRRVLRLPGVSEVFISPYELSVTIAGVYSWESLEPSILKVLCRVAFGADEKHVQIER